MPTIDLARCRVRFHLFMIAHPSNIHILKLMNQCMDTYRGRATKNEVDWYENDQKNLFAWSLGITCEVQLPILMQYFKICEPQNGNVLINVVPS